MDNEVLLEQIFRVVKLSFSRSGGAGGQNVNKVSTRVTARLALSDLSTLTREEVAHVQERLGSRVNSLGELVVHVDEERSQLRNRQIAVQRLFSLVVRALRRTKSRLPTHPGKAARERRLQQKKLQAKKKRSRRAVDDE